MNESNTLPLNEIYKDGDKVNILIAFYDNNDKIIQQNCFFKRNITIHENGSDFYLDTITDIKPINCSVSPIVKQDGLRFYFNPHNNCEVAFAYDAIFVVSKSLSYNEMKSRLFNKLIIFSEDRIKKLEDELEEEKEQLNLFNILKHFSADMVFGDNKNEK